MNNTVNDATFGCTSSDLCIEPPDPSIAVGPSHVVQTVNLAVRVYNRSGSTLVTGSLVSFFGTASDVGTSDPQVGYVAAINRWVMELMSWDCTNGYLHIAVSNSGDPTGTWSIGRITFADAVPDYPSLGLSDDKVMIGVNQYWIDPDTCDLDNYRGTSFVALDLADILDGTPTYYSYSDPTPDFFNWKAAINQSSSGDVHGLYTNYGETFNYVYGTGSVRDAAADPIGPNPFSLYDTGNSATAFAPGESIVEPLQPGGFLEVDNRVTSAVWRDGRLAFVSAYPCGADDLYACVRVSELDTDTETATQDFLIGDGSDEYDRFMGGVSIDANGTMYLVWSQSRDDTPVGIWATYQLATDDPDTLPNSFQAIKPGLASYDGTRWGDFVILSTDPVDSVSVWQAHEFARSNGGWGTFVSKLSIATAGRPDATIKKGTGSSIGTGIFNVDASGQSVTATKARGTSVTFSITIKNVGATQDSFYVAAQGPATTGYAVVFTAGGVNVTGAVLAGAFATPGLAPGGSYVLKAKVTVKNKAAKGSSTYDLVTATSTTDNSAVDAVKFTVFRK